MMKTFREDRYFQYGCQQPIRGYWLKRIVYPLANLLYHLLIYCIPVRKDECKYVFSLVLIFKNESPYLKEWLEYHLMLGIDHFYLYQNNSTDDYISVLKPYIDDGRVTMIDWPEYPGQYTAYLHWYNTFRHETRWVSFIDADEFLCPISDNSIQEVMAHYAKYPVVLVYWKLFGTNGRMKHDYGRLVIEQYIHCRP